MALEVFGSLLAVVCGLLAGIGVVAMIPSSKPTTVVPQPETEEQRERRESEERRAADQARREVHELERLFRK